MFEVKCADCECLPSDCKNSPSPRDCRKCTHDYCCCWSVVHKREN